MKHSVIIPAHDAARYLAACLASVLAQLGPGDEVIVVDDGSRDGTGAMARDYPDRRVIVITHDRNCGAAAARNTGLDRADGDVIHFLDSDDLWSQDRMTAARRLLADYPQCTAFSGIVVHFHCPSHPPASCEILPPPQSAALPGSTILRRAAVEAAGGFDTSLSSGEFIDYVARLRRSGATWMTSDAVLCHRRVHATNHSRADQKRAAAYLALVRRHLRARATT